MASTVKRYLITAEFMVTEDELVEAKAWAKKHKYEYDDDADLVVDAITDGVIHPDTENCRMDEWDV